MSVLHSQESEYVRELAKWESLPTDKVAKPKRPYTFQPYPSMFYKASRPPKGGPVVFEEHLVEDDTQAANMRSRGWGSGQAEAVAMLEAAELAVATAAAERAHSERRMSEKSRAEAQAYDESTAEHVPEIPVTPIRRRPGRPAKAPTT